MWFFSETSTKSAQQSTTEKSETFYLPSVSLAPLHAILYDTGDHVHSAEEQKLCHFPPIRPSPLCGKKCKVQSSKGKSENCMALCHDTVMMMGRARGDRTDVIVV